MIQDETLYDLIIIGAGPAGTEALLQAAKKGIKSLLLEKDVAGSVIKRTMLEKTFYHVYGRNTAKLIGDLAFPDRSNGGDLVKLWEEQLSALNFKKDCSVSGIKKDGDIFGIESALGKFVSKKVLLTFGTFEHANKLGIPGEENNPRVKYSLNYRDDYYKNKVIVVGGGNSALETAVKLAFDDNEVILVIRKNSFANTATDKNKKDIETCVHEGRLKILYESQLIEIQENTVKVNENGTENIYDYDVIFIHAGYQKPIEFLQSAGIILNEERLVLDSNFETNIKGLFVAGSLTGADSIIESANQAYEIIHKLTF